MRSHRNRFDNGGIFQHEIWGYDKPDGKSNESDVTKLPEAERIYDKWFTMLEGDENGEGAYNYRELADWLNDQGIPTGKLCKLEKWDGCMVRRYTFNTLLKGERRRNDRVTIRVNKTGRPKTVPAPEEHRLVRQCPHLAFIEPERYDRVIRKLKNRNAKYKRAQSVKQNSELTKYSKLLEAENRKLENLITGLAAIGSSDAMVCNIREAEDRVNELRDNISESKKRKQGCFVLPTLEEIQSVADVAFADVAVESIEFSRLMRELLDDFFVLPYRSRFDETTQTTSLFERCRSTGKRRYEAQGYCGTIGDFQV